MKLISSKNENSSSDFYIPVRHEFYKTKKKEDADFTYAINKNASESIKEITRLIDPQDKYSLTAKNLIQAINKRLSAEDIPFDYQAHNGKNVFNMYTLQLFDKFYHIKKDDRFCYKFENVFRYSNQLVDFISEEIRHHPDIINIIKEKIAPGS